MDITLTDFEKEINRILNGLVTNPSVNPRYRYYTAKDSRDRYFYTVGKINHNGKPKYVAGIYRYLKSKTAFKLVKKVGFSKRKTASARAYEWSKKAL